MPLKDLFDKGKCLVGLHQGEWRAASPNDCTFTRICERCHVETRRIEHLWPDWAYAAEDACDQVRVCTRCRQSESRTLHAWGSPEYVADGSCERHRVCGRCREAAADEPLHVLDSWSYVGPDDCTQVQTCGRCGATGAGRRVEHLWAAWQHSDAHGGPVRVCRRCGELQAQPAAVASSGAGTAAPAAAASPDAPRRKAMFEALKGKMQMLADQREAMERILGAMAERAEKHIARVGSEREPDPPPAPPPAPPVVTEDAVRDLLSRAGIASDEPPPRDARLIGHWRYVDIVPGQYGSPGMTTQYDLVLAEDGRFAERRLVSGPVGMSEDGPDGGEWRDEDGSLVQTYDSGEQIVRGYEFYLGELYFPNTRFRRPWERVR